MLRLYTLLFFCLLTSSLYAENVVFVQNQGQWPAEVLFRADIPGGHLYLKRGALHYVFYDNQAIADHHPGMRNNAPARKSDRQPNDQLSAHAVEVRFDGSNREADMETKHKSPTVRSYFLGSRQAGGVSAFSEVIYHNLYPGVDLRLYAYYQTLKYEFIVQPGTEPAIIRLLYHGADGIQVTDGRLAVKTSVLTFQENKPYAFVSRDGKSTEVAAQWQIDPPTSAQPEQLIRFQLPNGYDRTQQLTIDPELVFAAYSGSIADNWGFTATYDAEGNVYSGGIAFVGSFPATTGAYQTSFSGEVDVAILKFNAEGSQLLYASYLGGEWADIPHSLIVNKQGELVIFGTTGSGNFPITNGAFQTAFLGRGRNNGYGSINEIEYRNGSDMFVAKLSPDGRRLVASTFVGGTADDGLGWPHGGIENYGDEFRGEVIVGPNDEVYVASITASADFPLTDSKRTAPASNQTVDAFDGVVFQLSADLTKMTWGARLGGNRYDAVYGLKLTPTGTVFVCGLTASGDLPANPDAYQPRLRGREDGFIARFDNQQLARLTYIGTDSVDTVQMLDLGPDGSPHVLGLTRGSYPTSAGVYSNRSSGQFIHALDTDLRQTRFSTVVGSGRRGPDLALTALLVNECGNIYLAGWGGNTNVRTAYNRASSTTGLPITPDAYQRQTNGSNFYVAVLESDAKSLLYATFMGNPSTNPVAPGGSSGDHVDGGTSRFDRQGVIYHAACVCRGSTFPSTPQAWSRTNNSSNCNNLAFKFDVDRLKAGFDTYRGTEKGIVTGCTPLTLTFDNTSIGGRRYEWLVDGKIVSNDSGRVNYTFDKGGQYVITLRAYNPLTCLRVDSVKQTITVNPANFQLSPNVTICPDDSTTLRASGATKYVWSPAEGLSSTSIADPIAKPQETTTYTVEMSNEFGCVTRQTVTVQTDAAFRPSFDVQANGDCRQPTKLTFQNNTQNADQYVWVMGNGDTLRTNQPENYNFKGQSGQYNVTLIAYRNGCSLSTTQAVSYEDLNGVPNVITPNGDGKNDLFNIGFSGAKLEIFNRWGRRIYREEKYANSWGKDVPNGLYYYLLTTPNGTQCKGWIQVLE